MELEVDGHVHRVPSRQVRSIQVGGRTLEISAEVWSIRVFHHVDGITFVYPRSFKFEYKAEPYQSWTLRGPGVRIVVSKDPRKGRAEAELKRAAAFAKSYFPDAKITMNHPMVLGGKTLLGFKSERPGKYAEIIEKVVFEGPLGTYTFSVSQLLPLNGRPKPVTAEFLAQLSRRFDLPTDRARSLTEEAPPSVHLRVAGNNHLVAPGESADVEVAGRIVHIRARPLPLRLFDKVDGFRFPYPESFKFRFRNSTWTLSSGLGYMIKVWKLSNQARLEAYAANYLKMLRKGYPGATMEKERPFRLGSKTMTAIRIDARGGKDPRTMDFVGLEVPQGFYAFTFVSLLDEEGNPSPTAQEAMQLITEAFEFLPAEGSGK